MDSSDEIGRQEWWKSKQRESVVYAYFGVGWGRVVRRKSASHTYEKAMRKADEEDFGRFKHDNNSYLTTYYY